MKTLTTRAADLSARRELKPVPLVVLTTYTDRGAQTGPSVHRMSDRSVLYDWEGGGEQEFAPFLLGLDQLSQEMNHLPDLGNRSLERQMTIRLANLPVDQGDRLYEVLDAENLLFATVEVAQLLMDVGKGETLATVRALTGAEHQVWFRGEVVAHEADEAQITLTLRAIPRAIPWIVANSPTINDPLDLGRRLPIVYGARKYVPAVGWEVGWQTTLAETLTSTATGNKAFTDVSGLSGSGITVRLGQEEVTATYVNDTTLNITARGQNSTTAQNHGIGEVAIEMISNIRFIVAGHAVKAINNVYIQNPATGDVVRIPSGYTGTIADTGLISGKTVASVNFTAAQLRSVLTDLFPDVVAGGAPQVVDVEFTEQTNTSSTTSNTNGGINDTTRSRTAGQVRLTGTNSGGTPSETVRFSAAVGSTGEDAREVIRWRSRGVINLHQTSGHSSNAWRISGKFDPANWPDTDPSVTTKKASQDSYLGTHEQFGVAVVSSWESPTNRVVSDIEGSDILFYGSSADAFFQEGPFTSEWVECVWVGAQVEVLPASARFQGSLVGFGLRVFADVEGPVASGGNYVASDTALIEHPSDIMRHVIADLCGYGHGAVDDTTFDALATTSGVGSAAKMAAILNELGDDFATIIQRIAFECRANIVQEETATATVFKVYAASTSWAWGSSERTLDVYESVKLKSRDGESIATRFRWLYAPDLSRQSEEDIWTAALRADPDASDLASLTITTLANAEKQYGRRDHPGMALATVYDSATAIDVATYYGKELSRDARVLEVTGIPWWLGYDLERGSIVSITPGWSSTALKCRVVAYTKNHDSERVDATLVEVA